MKKETKLRSTGTILTLVLFLAGAWAQARAQSPPTQNPVEPDSQVNQAGQIPDLRPLNLTPEQVQKIREINRTTKDQRQTAGMKVRQARRALDEAVESPTPNQPLIEQRSRELADAQAGMIRLRSLVEARVVQEVLTPDQRLRLREMRRNQTVRRGAIQQRPGNALRPRQQRNVNAQPGLSPKERRQMRQQTKP